MKLWIYKIAILNGNLGKNKMNNTDSYTSKCVFLLGSIMFKSMLD